MSSTRELVLEQIDTSFYDYQQSKLLFSNQCFDHAITRLETSIFYILTAITICYSGEKTCVYNLSLVEFLINSEKIFHKKHLLLLKAYREWIEQPNTRTTTAKELGQWLALTEPFIEAADQYCRRSIKQWYSPENHKAKHQFYLRIRRLVLFIPSLLAILYLVFLLKKPTQYHETKGQFFWTTESSPVPSEEDSLRFKVIEDGAFHTYTIQSFVPIKTKSLRFDPITEDHSEIMIDFINYYGKNKDFFLTQSFDQSLEGWIPLQDIKTARWEEGALSLETNGNDPIIHSSLQISELTSIKIRMKVVLYQTYIQWLFS